MKSKVVSFSVGTLHERSRAKYCVSGGPKPETEKVWRAQTGQFSSVQSKKDSFAVILEHGLQKPLSLQTAAVGITVVEKVRRSWRGVRTL